jgi:hypothetical protein
MFISYCAKDRFEFDWSTDGDITYLLNSPDISDCPAWTALWKSEYTRSSTLTFSSNSPFCSENSFESTNKNNFNYLHIRIDGFCIRLVRYLVKRFKRRCTYSLPYKFKHAQKFFSGSTGSMQPPYYNTSWFWRNSKSLKRRLTVVSYSSLLPLRDRMVYSLYDVRKFSDMVSGYSMSIILFARNLT